MQKISIVLLFSFLFYNNLAFGQRESKEIVLNKGENSTKILSSNPKGLVVEINTNSFRQFIETIGNEEFYTVILENENLIEEKGYPCLPKIVKDICIPQMTDIQYRIVESEFIDVEIQIIPSKGILLRKINPHDIMYTFAEVYSKDSFFPKERLEFSTPYLMRNTRGSTLTIYPFAYNPIKKVLRVYTKLILEILFEGENENNSISNSFYEKNKYFEPILRNHFINYNTKSAFYDSDNHKNRGQSVFLNSVDETGSMLIITSDAFYDKVLPLANHKINAGLPTTIVKMSNIGSTSTHIYNYIQNYYNNHNDLTFVLLVGDHLQVPSMIVNAGSDPSYSLIVGNDNYPDIIVGRFSAETSNQVETMVSRTISYENSAEQNWFHAGIGIASQEGPGHNNEYDYQHLRNIRTSLLNYHYDNIAEFYEGNQGAQDATGNPTPAMVSTAINNGASIVNYTGHGNYNSWVTSGFNISNVNSLANENKLPFIFSVACQNGNFTNQTCFAEGWLRLAGSNGNPKGAIAFYGASINQAWVPPMEAQDEFNSLLTTDSYFTFGTLCFNAALKMISVYGANGVKEFKHWNIFGDPSVKVIPHVRDSCTSISLHDIQPEPPATHKSVTCQEINIDATVPTDTKLELNAKKEVNINAGFTVETGAELEINVMP